MEEWEDGEGCVDIDECSSEYQATLTDNGYGKPCAHRFYQFWYRVFCNFFPHEILIFRCVASLKVTLSFTHWLTYDKYLFKTILLIGATSCRNHAHTCVNTQGSFYCTCDDGYALWSKHYGCGEDVCKPGLKTIWV